MTEELNRLLEEWEATKALCEKRMNQKHGTTERDRVYNHGASAAFDTVILQVRGVLRRAGSRVAQHATKKGAGE